VAEVMLEGKLFQTRAAATEKERSPMVEWRATGTLSAAVDVFYTIYFLRAILNSVCVGCTVGDGA